MGLRADRGDATAGLFLGPLASPAGARSWLKSGPARSNNVSALVVTNPQTATDLGTEAGGGTAPAVHSPRFLCSSKNVPEYKVLHLVGGRILVESVTQRYRIDSRRDSRTFYKAAWRVLTREPGAGLWDHLREDSPGDPSEPESREDVECSRSSQSAREVLVTLVRKGGLETWRLVPGPPSVGCWQHPLPSHGPHSRCLSLGGSLPPARLAGGPWLLRVPSATSPWPPACVPPGQQPPLGAHAWDPELPIGLGQEPGARVSGCQSRGVCISAAVSRLRNASPPHHPQSDKSDRGRSDPSAVRSAFPCPRSGLPSQPTSSVDRRLGRQSGRGLRHDGGTAGSRDFLRGSPGPGCACLGVSPVEGE